MPTPREEEAELDKIEEYYRDQDNESWPSSGDKEDMDDQFFKRINH